MSVPRFSVSPVVRNKALAVGAAAWIDELPELVGHLEREWQIAVGRSYDSSAVALVAEATSADGTPAVLKLMIPRPGGHVRNAITFLRLAGGNTGRDAGGNTGRDAGGGGGVLLLRSDEGLGALLLERLGRSLDQLGLPIGRRHEILCAAAARIWRPAPGCGLPTGADHGRFLAGSITRTWTEFGRPCSARAVGYALACAARRIRAHDDERAVLVHGDVHQWNVLEAAGGYKLVDPNGMLAGAELDLGIVMREDPVELMHGDPRAGPVAGAPLRAGRHRDLGMGRRRARVDRAAPHQGRVAAGRTSAARRGRSRGQRVRRPSAAPAVSRAGR